MVKKTKVKKKNLTLAILLFVVLIVAVIALYGSQAKEKKNPSGGKPSTDPVEEVNFRGDIRYSDKVTTKVPEQAEKTILAYMDLYYQSMRELKEYDMRSLFKEDAFEQAEINQTALSLLVNIRKKQLNDLTLKDGKYTIIYQKITEKGNQLEIRFLEDNLLHFTFAGDIDAKSYGIENTMTLEKVGEEYKIVAYQKVEDFFKLINSNYESTGTDPDSVKQELSAIKEKMLRATDQNMEREKKWLEAVQSGETMTPRTCDHGYNREKALEYAKKYVVTRNDDWGNYSGYGGNCQNYASQVVYTGGVPMDRYGSQGSQWKWYGEEVDNTEREVGRVPSWAGVGFFYDYARYNQGFGLCAKVDVNIFAAEAGDILQVGYPGAWAHTVVAIGTIESEGKIRDILINSNSLDRENYPLSAYNYTAKRLIKVYGWNEK